MSFTPDMPAAPPPAPPPPNAPTMANAGTQTAAARMRLAPNGGVGSTLLTGGAGLTSPALTGGKALLGQ